VRSSGGAAALAKRQRGVQCSNMMIKKRGGHNTCACVSRKRGLRERELITKRSCHGERNSEEGCCLGHELNLSSFPLFCCGVQTLTLSHRCVRVTVCCLEGRGGQSTRLRVQRRATRLKEICEGLAP